MTAQRIHLHPALMEKPDGHSMVKWQQIRLKIFVPRTDIAESVCRIVSVDQLAKTGNEFGMCFNKLLKCRCGRFIEKTRDDMDCSDGECFMKLAPVAVHAVKAGDLLTKVEDGLLQTIFAQM